MNETDFRTKSAPSAVTRPESLYVYGVHRMDTQSILNLFEAFEPIGIEWVSDCSCNLFWYDTLSPLRLLTTIPPVNESTTQERVMKRKYDDISTAADQPAVKNIPVGYWREFKSQLDNESKASVVFYIRYTTVNDRKAIGSQIQSEYYRQHGNPNFE